jgi:hypothetical protein
LPTIPQKMQPEVLVPNVTDFSFVSPRSFLFVYAAEGGVIELYTFKDAPEPETTGPVLTAILRLPPLATGVELEDMRVTTGPWIARVSEGAPFGIDNAQRIYVFNLEFRARLSCTFVMRGSDLTKTMWTVPMIRGDLQIEWDEWVDASTRFFRLGNDFEWLRCIQIYTCNFRQMLICIA